MSREYCVPKRKVRAQVLLPSQAPTEVTLFLGDRAETHDGPERPSDLVNGSLAFIPALDHLGQIMLIRRDALMLVSLDARDEEDEACPQLAQAVDVTQVKVHVVLEDGTSIAGTAAYFMPDSQRRLQDFLNTSARFLTLRQDQVVHLINKRRIVRVLSD